MIKSLAFEIHLWGSKPGESVRKDEEVFGGVYAGFWVCCWLFWHLWGPINIVQHFRLLRNGWWMTVLVPVKMICSGRRQIFLKKVWWLDFLLNPSGMGGARKIINRLMTYNELSDVIVANAQSMHVLRTSIKRWLLCAKIVWTKRFSFTGLNIKKENFQLLKIAFFENRLNYVTLMTCLARIRETIGQTVALLIHNAKSPNRENSNWK